VRDKKLGQNIRRFTSNYLQENMLALPALPTNVQLRELRERKEREARERVKELERQRELQRQKEAQSAAGVGAASGAMAGATADERKGFDKFMDKMASSKIAVSFKKDSTSVEVDRGVKETGWITSRSEEIVDTGDDPFLLQKQQLLSYIKQARAGNRMDEVAALEQSLRDIELAIHQKQPMAFGFD
jgi:ribosomal protein L9